MTANLRRSRADPIPSVTVKGTNVRAARELAAKVAANKQKRYKQETAAGITIVTRGILSFRTTGGRREEQEDEIALNRPQS